MREEETVFEAVIVPHRSLSARGLNRVAMFLMAGSAAMSVALYLAGAWPVIGFTGAEAGLAIWLIRRHALGPVATETLTLSPAGVRVVREDRRGHRVEKRMAPGWLRVCVEERPGRVPALLLRRGGASLEIAGALGEEQKRSLAAALQDALGRLSQPIFGE